MSTKRIIILGGGFGEVKCAETLRDELPLDQAEAVPARGASDSPLPPPLCFEPSKLRLEHSLFDGPHWRHFSLVLFR